MLFTDALVAEMKAVLIQVVKAIIIKQGAGEKLQHAETVKNLNIKRNKLNMRCNIGSYLLCYITITVYSDRYLHYL